MQLDILATAAQKMGGFSLMSSISMPGQERGQLLSFTRRVQIEFQLSDHSRAMVGGIHNGKRQLPIWGETRVGAFSTAPILFACVLLLSCKFSLIRSVAQFHALIRVEITENSAWGGPPPPLVAN